MKKLNYFSLKSLVFPLLCVGLCLLVFLSSMPASSLHAASTYAYSTSINVVAQNYDGDEIIVGNTTSTLKYNNETTDDYTIKTVNWSELRNFVISYDTSLLPSNAESYTYAYTVSWTPNIISNNIADFSGAETITSNIVRETVKNKTDVQTSIIFTIDNIALSQEKYYTASNLLVNQQNNSYSLHGGWGLYIFSFEYNGTSTSVVFQVLPTDISALAKPEIIIDEISSNYNMKSAYVFSLPEEYKFVNRDLITWSIKGTGRDGLTYVLTPSDVEDAEVEHPIFNTNAYYRNGISFTFDTEIEGSWTAVCEIYQTADGASPKYTVTSSTVSTTEGMPPLTIVWIVVGSAVAAAIIVAVVIGLSVKKERVY